MAVVATNLIAGPAELWVAVFGGTAVEPTGPTTVPGAGWTNVGGTTGGIRLVCDREFFTLEVDQIVQRVGSVPTGEDFSIQTSLAEATLENFGTAMNKLAADITTAASVKTLELGGTLPGGTPNYVAVLLDGRAPNGKKRRVTLRKALSTASVEQAYQKAGQTVIPLTLTGHYVSSSIKPVRIDDEI